MKFLNTIVFHATIIKNKFFLNMKKFPRVNINHFKKNKLLEIIDLLLRKKNQNIQVIPSYC